jgi:D-sedoheptulose 7-phosphate isomerase
MDAEGGPEMNARALGAIDSCADYSRRLQALLAACDWTSTGRLAEDLIECWRTGRQVFICGNGGSAANAMHLANDFLYGISKSCGAGLRVNALSANASVITCLANDEGYDQIFSMQLAVHAKPGDLLIALSGSGNSPNILAVLGRAKQMRVRSCAILGYSGGKAKDLADASIHFAVDDMQISEDMQLVVGHMVMQWLSRNQPGNAG